MSTEQAAGEGAAGGKEQLSAIWKMIAESQALDGDGKEMGAYQSYLRSAQFIVQYLAADIITANETRGVLPRQPAANLFKMAKHCLERVEEMYETARVEGRPLARGETESGDTGAVPTPSQCLVGVAPQISTAATATAAHQPQYQSPASSHNHLTVSTTLTSTIPISTTSTSTTLPLPEPVMRAHSVPSGATLPPSTVSPVYSLGTSYMREARLRNQYMMEQYKAHLRKTSSQMLPHRHELGLSMLRRLEENISVARIKQQNLARKAKNRQLRLQQEDSKAVSKKTQVVRLSQLSVEEIKEHVTSFEHGKHFPILTALRNKLSEGHENLKNRITSGNAPPHHRSPSPHTPSPSSSSSSSSKSSLSTATEVYNFVNELLNNPDHPLSRLLGELQMEIFTLLKPVQSAREKAGDFPQLYISCKEAEPESQPECAGSSSYPAHPVPSTSQPTPDLTLSHSPTVTSPHPHTVTTVQDSLNRDPSHLDLFYMNNESETEDDDLFTLSCAHSDTHSEAPNWNPSGGQSDIHPPPGPGDRNFNSKPPEDSCREDLSGEGGDRLARLRAELTRELRGRSSSCEDGGKCVTQLHMVLPGEEGGARMEGGGAGMEEGGARMEGGGAGMEEGGAGVEGGAHMDKGKRGVTRRHTLGEDGGAWESDVRERGGACVDGGRCVTQVHVVTEEGGAGEPHPHQLTSADREGGVNTTIAPPTYDNLYTSADNLARHMQGHSVEWEGPLQLPTFDLPDGTVFSRPPPPPSNPEEEEEEEEEEVVFPGLFPLSCRCYYGDEEKMKELKEGAELVLTQAVAMIHSSLNKLEQVFTSCYPSLSSPTQREECQSVLESLFFPAILPPLLAAYRCKLHAKEVSMARNMCRHVNVTPKDLDVRKKFWLLEQTSAPYGEAMAELGRVCSVLSPSGKLTCLVSTSRLVVKCIDDHYEALGQNKGAVDSGVGVDDILPILSYIILRSGLPQLVSETALMEEFIQEGYVKGEEGFCLTSFMTALNFVSNMSS